MSGAVQQELSPAKQELLRRVRSTAPPGAGGPVPLRPGTGSPALVLVHPVGGALFCYAALTAALKTSSPVYGFADRAEDEREPPEQRVPRLASRYLAELRETDVPRPWVLGGWSFGGVVAYEMARQDGQTSSVLLLDAAYVPEDESTPPPDPVLREWFARDLARLGGARTGLDDGELAERYDIFEANSRALLAYRPGRYRGLVTLVLAEASPDVSGEWARYVSGRIDSHFVPGDHYELLAGSSAERVGRIVDDVLRAGEAA